MASTKLRLLLDESIPEPLASLIIGLVQSTARSTDLIGSGAKDGVVALCANEQRRIVVAVDSDFKHHSVEYGVIKINAPDRADDHCLYQIFYAFWISGLRAKCHKRRTSLTHEGVRIQNGKSSRRDGTPSRVLNQNAPLGSSRVQSLQGGESSDLLFSFVIASCITSCPGSNVNEHSLAACCRRN